MGGAVGVMEGGAKVDVNVGEGTVAVIGGVEVSVNVGGGERVGVGVLEAGGGGGGGSGFGQTISTHKTRRTNPISIVISLENRHLCSMLLSLSV